MLIGGIFVQTVCVGLVVLVCMFRLPRSSRSEMQRMGRAAMLQLRPSSDPNARNHHLACGRQEWDPDSGRKEWEGWWMNVVER